MPWRASRTCAWGALLAPGGTTSPFPLEPSAVSREHSQLILCHLVAQEHDTRLEIATGLGGELRETTRITDGIAASDALT